MELVLAATEPALADAWERFCGDLPGVRVHRGSILDVACDAVLSPANSFGFMDGGIDALYLRRFGADLQPRLQQAILALHHGELLVGAAEIVETGDAQLPWLIAAPTMRVPMALRDPVQPYLAMRAALLLVQHGVIRQGGQAGAPVRERVATLAVPGLGTGIGQVGPNTCARQVREAVEHVLLGQYAMPRTWAEASSRHQALYTDRPRRLQHED